MQQEHITTNPAAVATFCVCTMFRSGKLTSTEIRLLLDPFMASNMNCLIPEIPTRVTTSSRIPTTAESRYLTIRLRVQFATCEVGQQFSWFQEEHSAQTAGPQSTEDILFQSFRTGHRTENEAATFAGTRLRKLQPEEPIKTKRWSTLSKLTVDHCRVHCIPMGESWPASFVPNDTSLGEQSCETNIFCSIPVKVMYKGNTGLR